MTDACPLPQLFRRATPRLAANALGRIASAGPSAADGRDIRLNDVVALVVSELLA
jgi:hypothetical protein